MPEQIWFKEPSVLFAPDTWSKFVPTKDMSTAEALNSVVRFSTYFSVLLFFSTGVAGYLMAVPIIMVSTILLHNLFPNGKTIETFLSKTKEKATTRYTMPTKENPFMNVLLTEIQDDPNRADAAPTNRRDVKVEMYKAFQNTSDLYMDTTDLFDQSQAMRTFHTLQSAKVPNDLDGFKAWLAKGIDEPDFSSAAPARNAKKDSETYVPARGSHQFNKKKEAPQHHTVTRLAPEHAVTHLSGETAHLPNSTAKPSGTTPAKASK